MTTKNGTQSMPQTRKMACREPCSRTSEAGGEKSQMSEDHDRASMPAAPNEEYRESVPSQGEEAAGDGG